MRELQPSQGTIGKDTVLETWSRSRGLGLARFDFGHGAEDMKDFYLGQGATSLT